MASDIAGPSIQESLSSLSEPNVRDGLWKLDGGEEMIHFSESCRKRLFLDEELEAIKDCVNEASLSSTSFEPKRQCLPSDSKRPLQDFSVNMPRLSVNDLDLKILPLQVKAALDFLVAFDPTEVVNDTAAARSPQLLPKQSKAHQGLKTLALDLDETLVHCYCQPTPLIGAAPIPDVHIEIGEPPMVLRANVYVRPSARLFLRTMAKLFEVVIFTASAPIYADKVLNYLDPSGTLIAHRLYREACTELAGGHFKDLRRLNRPLKDVVLIDNSPLAGGLCPDNIILVSSWFGDDQQDTELLDLMHYLQEVATIDSFSLHLSERYGFRRLVEGLRAKLGPRKPSAAFNNLLRMSMLLGNTTGAVTQVQRR